MYIRSTLALAAAVSMLAVACAKKPAPVAQPTANVVSVIATDFAFQGPDTIPAGLTTFQLTNPGQEPHQLVLMRMDSGKTMADIQVMMAGNPDAPPPGWLKFPVGVSVITPGDTGNATAVLVPGHYVMACFVASPDGKSHIMKGMVRGLEVTPSSAPLAAEPVADIVITEKDYAFDLSAPITAGTHTFRVENAGPQLHEVSVNLLAPGKTVADVQAWVAGGMQGPPPARPMGGVTGPDVGGHSYFTATFAPGNYFLVCYVPDTGDGKPHLMHGMLKEFTVS
jgi:hypothetical protein